MGRSTKMPKPASEVIIGYYDEDGYAYCPRHAREKSDAIKSDGSERNYETCAICGVYLDDFGQAS